MSLIRRMRKQAAVWWSQTSPDARGIFGYSDPVQILCRWEDRAERYLDSKRQERVSRSLVYVDRLMRVGDRLMLGDLDSNTPENPRSSNVVFEIQSIAVVPNLRNTETLYQAYL